MFSIQVLNKILNEQSIDIVIDNGLDETNFLGYEKEFNFILKHFNKYNKTPDKETFIAKFDEFNFCDVKETNEFLVKGLREEDLFRKLHKILIGTNEKLNSDSFDALEFLLDKASRLNVDLNLGGKDIISGAKERLDIYLHKNEDKKTSVIETGFKELDKEIHGWERKEEFIVIFARTGQGKSWFLLKALTHAWKTGNRVGLISPEMGHERVGYRVDTLMEGFSNYRLSKGIKNDFDCKGYSNHIESISKEETPFIVATPKDFENNITATKIRAFIKANKLDIIGIDGITYIKDERNKKGDSKTIGLTNVSEDLMQISCDLEIPIITVVQSNRDGVKKANDNNGPSLENIRDSDGIAQNATKVIAIRQIEKAMQIEIKKHRDGKSDFALMYLWNIDQGEFTFIPVNNDDDDDDEIAF